MPYIGTKPSTANFSDLNGAKLILDADADTSITADTDDTIHIEIAGADDFTFTANTLTVLSGSTLTIASGATIANSGTATGFGSNVPTSADGQALGSASLEWSDLYLAESGVIYFGNDQDVTVTHDPDDGLFLKSTATTDNNPVLLTLQTGETDIAANDVLGKIAFQAPDEGTGTDAILVAAAIQARSEGDFAADANATSLDFMLGASEAAATLMTLNSSGNLSVGDGTASLPSYSNTGDLNTGVYFPAADTVGVVAGGTEQFRFGSNPIPGGGKNLVQNGAMTVNQRGSTAVAADGTFAIDRYSNRLIGGGPARWTVTQDTTVPAGKGFGYSYKVDVTTIDASISTDDYHGVTHTIEAQNLQHLNFNNAAASALTLTFWARTKKAGLHGGAVYNNDANRSLVFSWTAVSDEWQKVTIAVPGDASGVINNDTGSGLTIYWSFSGGKFMASDTGAWVAGAYLSVTSAVNDFDHVDNDFYITGVQLEVGSVATDFAHEDYGTTLHKCKRYFERWSFPAVKYIATAFVYSTGLAVASLFCEVVKRAAPTISIVSVTGGDFLTSGGFRAWTNASFDDITLEGGRIALSDSGSGLSADGATAARVDANNHIDFSAEL